jgi:hypothetical protein
MPVVPTGGALVTRQRKTGAGYPDARSPLTGRGQLAANVSLGRTVLQRRHSQALQGPF